MKITTKIFRAFIDCPYKGYLYKNNVTSKQVQSPYLSLLKEKNDAYQEQGAKEYFKVRLFTVTTVDETLSAMKIGQPCMSSPEIAQDNLHAQADYVEKVRGKSSFGNFEYQPVIFRREETVTQNDKINLGFFALVLTEAQKKKPKYGTIISGTNDKKRKVMLDKFINLAKKVVKKILEQEKEPKILLNSHCKVCEFQTDCFKKAKEQDDLSLLSRIGLKEIEALNRRGIFTTTQLSHIFRPSRQHKSLEIRKRPHSFSLHALAIRENKIYTYNCHKIPTAKTKIFLDVEYEPFGDVYYLIGIQVVNHEKIQNYQLWADSKREETQIFENLLDILKKESGDCKIFHYGNFETKYIKRMAKKLQLEENLTIKNILENMVNVVEYIYPSIYFPVYSNDLKSIATYLGYNWKSQSASGQQSIVWRKLWESTKNDIYKNELLDYNLDDCNALKLVTEKIKSFDNPDNTSSTDAEKIKIQKSTKWGKVNFLVEGMKEINSRAYYDYQRDRVYIRTGVVKKQKAIKPKFKTKQYNKINKTITVHCNKCPSCQSTNIAAGSKLKRTFVDLKFFQSGVRRWVLRYISWSYSCLDCMNIFTSSRYRPTSRKRIRIKYGQGLLSWVIYQHLVNNQSFRTISDNLHELFGIVIAAGRLHEFKTRAFNYYRGTFQNLKRKALESNVLVADEAKMKLNDTTGYAWVFANANVVIYEFKKNREGEFLGKYLKDFKGVIVSDFYAAYDSLPCTQQKCLIHLMRDFNEDITKMPFDSELKDMARLFTVLLRKIVETVDKRGLKKRYLERYKKDVNSFFKEIEQLNLESEISVKYKKRLLKNRAKLFTFISHDDVPWNSNAAEHAIKHLARLRKRGMSSFTESRVDEYMQLISIYKTCEYQGISFFKFLLSGATRIK